MTKPSTDGTLNNNEAELLALDGLAAAIEDNVCDERRLARRIR